MNRDEFISLDDNEVVDIVERRIKWRFSDEEYSIFMIGLSPGLSKEPFIRLLKLIKWFFGKFLIRANPG